MLSSDDTACIAFDRDEDSIWANCTCGHPDYEHEDDLGGCECCVFNRAGTVTSPKPDGGAS